MHILVFIYAKITKQIEKESNAFTIKLQNYI